MSASERELEGEYDPLENPWYVHGPIALLLVTMGIERGVTLLFWRLESNPIVNTIGPVTWSILTVVLFGAIIGVWYLNMGFDVKINRLLVYSISIYHALAAVSNLAVILFY